MEPCNNPLVLATLAFGLTTGGLMMRIHPEFGTMLLVVAVGYLLAKVSRIGNFGAGVPDVR